MAYKRIYPEKNNTIFYREVGSVDEENGTINTGTNPIFELMDGNSESIIVLKFPKIEGNNISKINLKLFDAGVVREPVLENLKSIDLFYFNDDFIEGDGWSFDLGKTKNGVSNWNFRDNVNGWGTAFDNHIMSFLLDHYNQDVVFEEINNYILNELQSNDINTFGIKLSTHTPNEKTFSKFIYSRHTRTIFKPYLEIFYDDQIKDSGNTLVVGEASHLYINVGKETNLNFSLIATVMDAEFNQVISLPVTHINNGWYKTVFTPNINMIGFSYNVVWEIVNSSNGNKRPVKTKVVNIIDGFEDIYTEKERFTFYPTIKNINNQVMHGDIIPVSIILRSFLKTYPEKYLNKFEYRVYASNGFEMIPWSGVNHYNGKLFFNIETDYFYPGIDYEIQVRLNLSDINGSIMSSNNILRFKLNYSDPKYMEELSSSPWSDKNIYLKRN